jgi:hypothetical protein
MVRSLTWLKALCNQVQISSVQFLLKGGIPSDWKKAKLTPLHKKGECAVPKNYHMIAVSGGFYLVFAGCLNKVLMDWTIHKRCLPDSQFGFIPKRSTLQAAFLLRHCIHAAKHSGKPLLVAFIDFQAAYDSVDRAHLMSHLQALGLPPLLLNVLKDIYAGDLYVLIDGDKIAVVHPQKGVKQGCPLSPTLFALFISDLPSFLGGTDHTLGAITGTPDVYVRDSEMADDLALLANAAMQLTILLQQLNVYSKNRGLAVNPDKSKIVEFN